MDQKKLSFANFGGFVTDKETTGVVAKKHSIIDIGSVHLKTGDEFSGECRIFEGAEVSEKALEVNGATRERLVDPALQTEADLIKKFSEWVLAHEAIDTGLLTGQNPTFDLDFTGAARARAGFPDKPTLFSRRTIDMHTLAVSHAIKNGFPIPAGGMSADVIYKMLGMPEEPKPHVGLTGARFEAVAIAALMEVDAPQLAKQRAFVESCRIKAPAMEAPELDPVPLSQKPDQRVLVGEATVSV